MKHLSRAISVNDCNGPKGSYLRMNLDEWTNFPGSTRRLSRLLAIVRYAFPIFHCPNTVILVHSKLGLNKSHCLSEMHLAAQYSTPVHYFLWYKLDCLFVIEHDEQVTQSVAHTTLKIRTFWRYYGIDINQLMKGRNCVNLDS